MKCDVQDQCPNRIKFDCDKKLPCGIRDDIVAETTVCGAIKKDGTPCKRLGYEFYGGRCFVHRNKRGVKDDRKEGFVSGEGAEVCS